MEQIIYELCVRLSRVVYQNNLSLREDYDIEGLSNQ